MYKMHTATGAQEGGAMELFCRKASGQLCYPFVQPKCSALYFAV